MKRRNLVKIDDAAYYEAVWAKEEHVRHGHHFDTVRMEALVRDVRPGDSVLDVGAGVFGSVQYIAERRPDLATCRLVAFDQSYTARDEVRKVVGDRIEWFLGDAAAALPWPDAAFDVVVCGELVEHMENPSALAGELVRVTRRTLAVSTLDHECPQAKAHDYPEHLWEMDPQDMVDLFPGGRYERCGNYHLARWDR